MARVKRIGKRAKLMLALAPVIAAASLAVASLAFGDQVVNDLDNSIDDARETMNLTVGGSAGSTVIRVVPTGNDGKSGCNLQGNTEAVTFSVASDNPSAATVSPSSIIIDDCGDTPTVTVTPASSGGGGTANITFTETANSSGASWDPAKANFSAVVAGASTPPSNQAPTANAGGPYSGPEGALVALSGSGSDTDGTIASYKWTRTPDAGANAPDAGADCTFVDPDGVAADPSTLQSPSVLCTDDGVWDLALTVTDNKGVESAPSSTSLTISNANPTAEKSFDSTVEEGTGFSLALTDPSDPGSNDTFTYQFDCGDGNDYDTASTNTSRSCPTTDDDVRSVGAKIIDDDGGSTEYTGIVTVTNVAPTVDSVTVQNGSGTACLGGNTVSLSFSFSDPGADANWGYVIDWGDGTTTPANGTTPVSTTGTVGPINHVYGAGTYTPTVTVTDKDGASGSGSASAGAVALLYNLSGILSPFNPDGSSVWKYGSTIPVKVRITDCNGTPVGGLAPRIGTSMNSSLAPEQSVQETASTSAADTTGVMRYDSGAGQYIYNFASKHLADGNATYYMYVRGKDSSGTTVTGPAQVSQKFGVRTK